MGVPLPVGFIHWLELFIKSDKCLALASSDCSARVGAACMVHVDGVSTCSFSVQAGSGPIESKIPANLRANFSTHYLSQEVDGRSRKEASPALV